MGLAFLYEAAIMCHSLNSYLVGLFVPGPGLALGFVQEVLRSGHCPPLHLKRIRGVASTAESHRASMWLYEPRCTCLECTGPGAVSPAGGNHLPLSTPDMAPCWVYSLPEQERDSTGPAYSRSSH